MTDTSQRACDILKAAAAGDRARLRWELATAEWLEASPGNAGEQERWELLAAVSTGMREALTEGDGRRAGDAVGEAADRVKVCLSLLRHLAEPGRPARPYVVRTAIASISTRTSRGRRAASTVARAGALSAK